MAPDVASSASVTAMVADTMRDFGTVEILVKMRSCALIAGS